MNFTDILLILALGVALFFALRRTIRTRRSGGCGCGCADCGGACGKRKEAKTN